MADKMRPVLKYVEDWGCPFPDFDRYYNQQDNFQEFESQHMTRPMTEPESLWLRGAILEALDTLRPFGLHEDEGDTLSFREVKQKEPLGDNVAVDKDPYGMLSGHVTGLGDLHDASVHQTRSGGTCLYVAYPVAVVFSESWLERWLESQYVDRFACVVRGGEAILRCNDPYGRGYRKLLAEFVRKQPESSELRRFLSAEKLPPSCRPTSDDVIESWAVYLETIDLYANEAVWEIMHAFLPCVKPFLLSSSSHNGPFRHNPNNSIVSSLGEPYTGNCVGILLVLLHGGGLQ
jgi:hypothetical protein